VICAIGGWFLHVLSQRNERDAALPELPDRIGAMDGATSVTVAPVTFRSIAQAVDIVGTLKALEEIPISSQVDGIVHRLHQDVGARLRPGDMLAEIDPESYRLAVEQSERSLQVDLARLGLSEPPTAEWDATSTPSVVQAQARLEQAESRWLRLQKLSEANAATEADLNLARSDFASAKAEREHQIMMANSDRASIRMKQTALELARMQLRDSQLVVPTPSPDSSLAELMSGDARLFVVTQRLVSEGAFVRGGTQLFTLAVDRQLKMQAGVPEKFSRQLAVGQSVAVSTAAVSQPVQAVVSRVYPMVDPETRTFDIEVRVLNPEGLLKPGSFAKATVQVELRNEAPAVPVEAIVSMAGVTKLFLLEGDRVREVQVKLGQQFEGWIEIVSPDIPPASRVITSGSAKLATGSLVKIRESIAPASAEDALGRVDASHP
jgi:multidrug efflux pump subunit AcrA (membrane-fusion protein)